MFQFLVNLFGTDFMPHVYCLRDPAVVALHVVSDALIAAAYFTIPVTLLLLLRQRKDLVFPWIFGLFGLFIFACGSTHVLAIWTLWHPIYRFEGVVKAVTALASVLTAVLLYRLMPQIRALPSPTQFRTEILERKRAEEDLRQLNLQLEARVQDRTDELEKSNSHLKALNQRFHHNEMRYRVLVETMPQFVWTAAEDGRVEYMSRQWVEYTGVPQAAHLGAGWLSVLHPDDRDATVEAWKRSVAVRMEYVAEYRIRRSDGAYRWFKARGIPMEDSTSTAGSWLGTCTDIDAQKRASQALERHNRHLEDLAFATAHHLQEPLRTLRLQTQLLVKHCSDKLDETASGLVFEMDDTTRRLRQLLRDFLSYSEANTAPPHREAVQLRTVVETALERWRPQLKEVRGNVNLQCSALDVDVNIRQLEGVFEHLIANAIKYRDINRPLSLTFTSAEADGEMIVSVADNGIGIESIFHQSIFGLFKRLHSPAEYPGTGLGLALCQRIMEMHGQRIWVESQPGVGSTFYLTLRKSNGEHTDKAELSASYSGG